MSRFGGRPYVPAAYPDRYAGSPGRPDAAEGVQPSRLEVETPAGVSSREPADAQPDKENAVRMEAIRITTALLVDDEPISRRANQERLEREGYTVFVAQNQEEALSRAKQSSPKVIFIHLVATSLGSLPLIQALRSDDNCRHIPVVVIADKTAARPGQKKLRSVNREEW
jgi:CheY-like chemotaxis protein